MTLPTTYRDNEHGAHHPANRERLGKTACVAVLSALVKGQRPDGEHADYYFLRRQIRRAQGLGQVKSLEGDHADYYFWENNPASGARRDPVE